MIVQTRFLHRVVVTVLAILAPILLVMAIQFRRPPAVMTTIPPLLDTEMEMTGEPVAVIEDVFSVLPVKARLYPRHHQMMLELEPRVDPRQPELLVYWESLADPEDRFLLGSLTGARTRRFALPAHAGESDGYLVLYAAGHDREVDRGMLPTVDHYRDSLTAAGVSP